MCFDRGCNECLPAEECLELLADGFVCCRCESGVLDKEYVDVRSADVPGDVLSFFLSELVAVPCGYFEVALLVGLEQ